MSAPVEPQHHDVASGPSAGCCVGGRDLAAAFYRDAVAPLLGGVPHAAALLGDGSEVLGLDDDVSPDHDFGPRCQIFVGAAELTRAARALDALPSMYGTLPVRFAASEPGSPSEHHVEVTTAADFFAARLGRDPDDGWSLDDWLLTPTQRLATLTADAVFDDPGGDLARRRAVLRWYPDDVWRYVLASAWWRIDQELPFVGRCGGRGDDLGSRVIASRIARELMRISFLVEQVWAPYSKWLGTAFARLGLVEVQEALSRALAADDWRQRESALGRGGSLLIARTNQLGLGDPVQADPITFHQRDIQVLPTEELTSTLFDDIADPDVRALVARAAGSPPGSIDQVVDSVDVLVRPERCRAARGVVLLGS